MNKTKEEKFMYAQLYSHKVRLMLIRKLKTIENYHISVDEVSNIVLNAIGDALCGMRMPDFDKDIEQYFDWENFQFKSNFNK